MGTGTTITISIIAAACIGCGLYSLIQKKKKVSLSIEEVETIVLDDVIAWYKSLNLNSASQTPFICDNLEFLKIQDKNLPEKPYVMIGVYNDKTKTIENHKLIKVSIMSKEIEELLNKSDNRFVVLS